MMSNHRTYCWILIVIVTSFFVAGNSRASMTTKTGSSSLCRSPGFPRWTFDPSHLYPPDRPLARPEDGKALHDGRLVVADETHGLLLLEQDGSHRPFGQLQKAGYIHNPPKVEGGAPHL